MTDQTTDRAPASDVLTVAVETAQITTRAVDRGGLRLETVTDVVEETLAARLRHGEVEITRVPVDRVVETAPAMREENGVTIIPVLRERAVITTELVLVEEIHLTPRETTEDVSIPVALRRQRVIETPLPPENNTTRTDGLSGAGPNRPIGKEEP